uniref:Deuterosome assembly protein 1 n=1 Tax=Lepisosteus oculatus TaxID=7918 RepID=W5MKM6_LEPOC
MQHLEDGIPQQIHAGLPSCEEELQELMHQIDIMVSRRKQEWERHSQALQACLDAREQELLHARAALDHKHQEVATLQCHIKEMKNSNKELVQKYEERLNTLQSELHKLKVSYEKLQRHHMKQAQEATNEEDSTFESSRLSRKLEDLQAKSKEWEKQSTLHQKELAILESQRRSLAEKCEYFQNWDSAEQRHEEEVNSAEREQQGEIQHLQQSLIQHQNKSACRANLPLMRWETLANDFDYTSLLMPILQVPKQKKIVFIYILPVWVQKTGEELKAELKVRDDLLQTAELQEKQWRGEVARLQEQLSMQESAIRAEPSCSHCMQLKGSSSVVRENVQWQLKAAGENKDNEIVKLKGILEKLEVSQNTQAEASRDEISRLTAQLRDTESARASAIQRATLLQNELRKIKGKAAEHQVAKIQLEAVSLENKYLKELITEKE